MASEQIVNEVDQAYTLSLTEPGLSDEQVMRRVADVLGGDPVNPKSPVGLVMMQAYVGGIAAAQRFSVACFGIDFTGPSSQFD